MWQAESPQKSWSLPDPTQFERATFPFGELCADNPQFARFQISTPVPEGRAGMGAGVLAHDGDFAKLQPDGARVARPHMHFT
jgi:hypothetical protein